MPLLDKRIKIITTTDWKNMFKKFAATAVLALLSTSAFAALPTGFYAGVNAGSTKIDDFDGNESAFGGLVGYGFNPNVAVEVGYRQHGTWEFYGADVKIKQTDISVVAGLPLGANFDLYGRLGYANAKVEVKGYGYAGDDDTNNALYGIGLGYTFSPNLSARLEVQRPASDVTHVGAALIWKF
jgi:hypothetical protein